MPAYQMVQTKERGSEDGDKEKERRRMESSRKMRRKRREGKGEERRLSGDALDVNSRLRIFKKKKRLWTRLGTSPDLGASSWSMWYVQTFFLNYAWKII